MMSRTMPVPIFQIPKTQISSDFEDLEERNSIFNLKLSFLENGVSDSENKRLLTNKEAELQFENLIDKNQKKQKCRIRQNSKSCKPYVCSKKTIANSDDENFWRAAMNHLDSIEIQRKNSKSEEKEATKMENLEKDYESEDMSEENIFCGNITVTIKDKPCVESKEENLEILRKSFEAFKINAQESRRLRELKTKVQEKVALKRMKRCFHAWRNRVTSLKVLEKKRREEREMSNERKIELFINAITEKQKQLKRLHKSISCSSPRSSNKSGVNQRCKSAPEETTNDNLTKKRNFSRPDLFKSNSQTRLQAQRKIIEEQRFKLAQQNKIIEDLRLKEIEREAKKAHRDTIDATRSAFVHCGKGTKRSLISLMKEQGFRDESAETLRVPNTPDFLIRMEARAEARKERVRKSEEARIKRIEEEKKKEEELRKREEIERKRLQMEAQKEAKRLGEEREEKRIREIERTKLLNEKADQFYRRFLLRRYILQPLVVLLLEKRKFLEKAIRHYDESLVKKAFLAWKWELDEQRSIKEELALSVYQRNLLLSSFLNWKNYTLQERRKYHAASDFHDLKVEAKIFKLWRIRTLEMKTLTLENEEMARDHREMKLKERFFNLWKRFPQISEEVKKSERQKNEWRELIQRVIPDFDPRHRGVAIDD